MMDEIENNQINIRLAPMGRGNDWCLYLIFKDEGESNYVESKLGAFNLYFSLKNLQLTIIIHAINDNATIPLYAELNDLQFVLIKNQRITHLATTYSDKLPVEYDRVYAVVPKYHED